jgi:hypothetical protein
MVGRSESAPRLAQPAKYRGSSFSPSDLPQSVEVGEMQDWTVLKAHLVA